MRVTSFENTTENISALADVIATITFKACNLPVGLLCYVEWENENGRGETPAAKVGRNGRVEFAPVEAKVTLMSTPSSLGYPLLESFFRLTLVTPKTVLSKFTLIKTFNRWNHHHLIGACCFNLGQKMNLNVKDEPQARSFDLRLELQSERGIPQYRSQDILMMASTTYNVDRLKFGNEYFVAADGIWSASEERDCFINGFSFAKELTKSIGFKTNDRGDRSQQQGHNNASSSNFSNNSHHFARAKSALLFEIDAFSPAPTSSPRNKHAINRGMSPVRSGESSHSQLHLNVNPPSSGATATTVSPTTSNNIANDKRREQQLRTEKPNTVQFFDPFKVEDNPFARKYRTRSEFERSQATPNIDKYIQSVVSNMKTLNTHQTVGGVGVQTNSNSLNNPHNSSAMNGTRVRQQQSPTHAKQGKPKSLKDQILPLLRVKKGDQTMTAEEKMQQWEKLKIEILHQLVEEKEKQKQKHDRITLSPEAAATRKSKQKEHEQQLLKQQQLDHDGDDDNPDGDENESLMTALTGHRHIARDEIPPTGAISTQNVRMQAKGDFDPAMQFRQDLYDSFGLTEKEEASFHISLDDGSFLSETGILIDVLTELALGGDAECLEVFEEIVQEVAGGEGEDLLRALEEPTNIVPHASVEKDAKLETEAANRGRTSSVMFLGTLRDSLLRKQSNIKMRERSYSLALAAEDQEKPNVRYDLGLELKELEHEVLNEMMKFSREQELLKARTEKQQHKLQSIRQSIQQPFAARELAQALEIERLLNENDGASKLSLDSTHISSSESFVPLLEMEARVLAELELLKEEQRRLDLMRMEFEREREVEKLEQEEEDFLEWVSSPQWVTETFDSNKTKRIGLLLEHFENLTVGAETNNYRVRLSQSHSQRQLRSPFLNEAVLNEVSDQQTGFVSNQKRGPLPSFVGENAIGRRDRRVAVEASQPAAKENERDRTVVPAPMTNAQVIGLPNNSVSSYISPHILNLQGINSNVSGSSDWGLMNANNNLPSSQNSSAENLHINSQSKPSVAIPQLQSLSYVYCSSKSPRETKQQNSPRGERDRVGMGSTLPTRDGRDTSQQQRGRERERENEREFSPVRSAQQQQFQQRSFSPTRAGNEPEPPHLSPPTAQRNLSPTRGGGVKVQSPRDRVIAPSSKGGTNSPRGERNNNANESRGLSPHKRGMSPTFREREKEEKPDAHVGEESLLMNQTLKNDLAMKGAGVNSFPRRKIAGTPKTLRPQNPFTPLDTLPTTTTHSAQGNSSDSTSTNTNPPSQLSPIASSSPLDSTLRDSSIARPVNQQKPHAAVRDEPDRRDPELEAREAEEREAKLAAEKEFKHACERISRFHVGLVRNPFTKYQNAEASVIAQIDALAHVIPIVIASSVKPGEEDKRKRESLTDLGGKLKSMRASRQTLIPMCSREIQNIHHADEEIVIATKSLSKMAFEDGQYEMDFAIEKLVGFIDALDASIYALMKVVIRPASADNLPVESVRLSRQIFAIINQFRSMFPGPTSGDNK